MMLTPARRDLQEMRDACRTAAEDTPNQNWNAALLGVARACDHLDAVMARTDAGAAHWSFDGGTPENDSAGTELQGGEA